MNNWQSGYVNASGLRLHYTRTGGAKPPVVLAHGFSDDGLCWTPVAEQLASDYDVIMLDARGHGRSDGPEEGYGSVEHASDLAGLCRALDVQQPAVLGHSMGAATALAFAGLYPDLPRAILLEDPPNWWVCLPGPGAAPGQAPRRRYPKWIVDLKRKTGEEMIADQRASSPSWSEAELGPWADSKLRLSLNVVNPDGAAPLDWPAVVQKIICRVLLITADPELGAIVKPEDATALVSLVNQTRVAHIAGAGHNIRREQFARYMDIVKNFLSETTK